MDYSFILKEINDNGIATVVYSAVGEKLPEFTYSMFVPQEADVNAIIKANATAAFNHWNNLRVRKLSRTPPVTAPTLTTRIGVVL